MKISEALAYARLNLKLENAPKISSILLSAFLGKPREYLIVHQDEELRGFESFKEWIQRANEHFPIEYITQKASFYSREFFVSEGVLIPRPETEILVDKASELIRKNKLQNILEIGTGSGIISVMLSLLNKNINITATDINPKAIALATKNAEHFGLKNLKLVKTDMDEGLSGEFDMIVSNPPYISPKVKLDANVMYEPREALFSQNDGLFMLEGLVKVAKKRSIKYLVCEMGYDQKDKIRDILVIYGAKEFEFYKDLSSHDRGFVARFC